MKSLEEAMREILAGSSKANMPTTSNTSEQPNVECPFCRGLGFVREDVPIGHPHFGQLFPCRCRLAEIDQRRMEHLRRLSNLEHLKAKTFETFVPEGYGLVPRKASNLHFAFEMAQQFAENPTGWLVLLGGYMLFKGIR